MENERHSLSSLPMLARLDHLDFIIKNLEKHENYNPRWREVENGMMTRGRPPLDTAVRDAYFKGSLLERVAALENRLFQLCMELESSSTSSTSTGGSGGEPSSQRTKRDLLRTLPTLSNINPFHIPLRQPKDHTPAVIANNATDKPDVQGMAQKVEEGKEKKQKTKQPNEKKKTATDVNKSCKSKKTKYPKKWSHFNLLGC